MDLFLFMKPLRLFTVEPSLDELLQNLFDTRDCFKLSAIDDGRICVKTHKH